jgi:two-component system chemotaxis response regulator CheB
MSATRVLVAEDSATARELLVGMLSADPAITVIGTARNGEEAIAMTAALRPDVVTMDVRMPGIDGLEATRRIMAQTPTPIVIISGHYDVVLSLEALRAGALTILPKPSGPHAENFAEQCAWLVRTVKSMAAVKVVRRRRGKPAAAAPATARLPRARPRIVSIAASTGGPAALAQVLGGLPPAFPLPLLVVQHIANGFADGLARWLDGVSPLSVRIAGEGEALAPGTVYLAPDDHHLMVRNAETVTVARTPPVDGFRPSASVLFESAARVFGGAAVAVVLTGMGEDGVSGIRSLHAAGGCVIAQDEQTSVIYGMPGATVAAGLADYVLPLPAIAKHIEALAT